MFEIPDTMNRRADEILQRYPVSKRSATLPLLHLVQEWLGYIPDQGITWVAERLGLERVQVLEVVTFYPGFRQQRPGRHHIRVCRTLSCAMAGSFETMEKICEHAGIDRSKVDHHHPIAVSKDGKFSVEFAECLASCHSAPVCLIGDKLEEHATAEKIADILDSTE